MISIEILRFSLLRANLVHVGSCGEVHWMGLVSQESKGQPHFPIFVLGACPSSFCFIAFIFVISWLKSFTLIKDDSVSQVPGMA